MLLYSNLIINLLFSFGVFLFCIGIFGLFAVRKNMIIVLMAIEIILLAATSNFIFFSLYLDDIVGQIFSMMILTVAAAESAVGLALIVLHYRHRSVISIDAISFLKG
jgi:NADH-quinone oxidoreductase subunit K